MHIMDIPVPILIGINKDRSFIYENNLDSAHDNCMFVLLDDEYPIEITNVELLERVKESSIHKKVKKKII